MAFEKRRIAKDKCLTYTVNSVYDGHHPGGDPNSLPCKCKVCVCLRKLSILQWNRLRRKS